MGGFLRCESGVASGFAQRVSEITDLVANSSANPPASRAAESPFWLGNESGYQAWKRQKLSLRESLDPARTFHLDPNHAADAVQISEMRRQIDGFNFILFGTDSELTRPGFLRLNRAFGLNRLDLNPGAGGDAVTLLQVVEADDPRARYIPYTARALNWHTDGYYNPPERRIRAFSLYCVRPAGSGGENFLLDHEMVYLLLRDTSPDLMAALMAPEMMRIPANRSEGQILRAEQSGPVFAIDYDGRLQMRYSSRPRNVIWRDDEISRRALELLREILDDSDAITELALGGGQGVTCNNILHGRHAFSGHDRAARLFYRARYHDAIGFGDR